MRSKNENVKSLKIDNPGTLDLLQSYSEQQWKFWEQRAAAAATT